MRLRFKKISPTHHRFEYIRTDGTGETIELETKSFLFHDFLHYSVETEANLKRSFYGLLGEGQTYAVLSGKGAMKQGMGNEEIRMTEIIIGPLTSVIKENLPPETFLLGMKNILDASELFIPSWLTEDTTLRIQEKFRKTMGAWRGTPFGSTLELAFPEEASL